MNLSMYVGLSFNWGFSHENLNLILCCFSSVIVLISVHMQVFKVLHCVFIIDGFGMHHYFKSNILFTAVVKMRDPFYMQLLLHRLFQKLFLKSYIFLDIYKYKSIKRFQQRKFSGGVLLAGLICVLFKTKMLTSAAGLERCHEKSRGGDLCGCTQKQQE